MASGPCSGLFPAARPESCMLVFFPFGDALSCDSLSGVSELGVRTDGYLLQYLTYFAVPLLTLCMTSPLLKLLSHFVRPLFSHHTMLCSTIPHHHAHHPDILYHTHHGLGWARQGPSPGSVLDNSPWLPGQEAQVTRRFSLSPFPCQVSGKTGGNWTKV